MATSTAVYDAQLQRARRDGSNGVPCDSTDPRVRAFHLEGQKVHPSKWIVTEVAR